MELLSGKAVASALFSECAEAMNEIRESGLRPPLIHVFQFGNDPSSSAYVKRIGANCSRFGIGFEYFVFDERNAFRERLAASNDDPEVSAVMLQQPLPRDLADCVDTIPYLKDVEGVTANSLGRLFKGEDCLKPCTAQAVIEIIDRYGIDAEGKKVVVAGRSNIVGKPLSILFLNKNATVTVCHSKTANLAAELKSGDIAVISIGRANFVTDGMIAENAVVIDVGTNYSGDKVTGDVDFDKVCNKVSKITPVPGGVGAVTNAVLIKNIITSYNFQSKHGAQRKTAFRHTEF
jgi:methylenetetrahydrofolate dehydrogenase (NADP+)/methenyltetrahydrofolate cyclohydrolase